MGIFKELLGRSKIYKVGSAAVYPQGVGPGSDATGPCLKFSLYGRSLAHLLKLWSCATCQDIRHITFVANTRGHHYCTGNKVLYIQSVYSGAMGLMGALNPTKCMLSLLWSLVHVTLVASVGWVASCTEGYYTHWHIASILPSTRNQQPTTANSNNGQTIRKDDWCFPWSHSTNLSVVLSNASF